MGWGGGARGRVPGFRRRLRGKSRGELESPGERTHHQGPWAAVKLGSVRGAGLSGNSCLCTELAGPLERGLVVAPAPCCPVHRCLSGLYHSHAGRLEALGNLAVTCLQTALALQDPWSIRGSSDSLFRSQRRALYWRGARGD